MPVPPRWSWAVAAVLVVDDDAHIREVARFALARAGHAVELAGEPVIETVHGVGYRCG